MYTVVPKHPRNESEKDPFPFLENYQNWGLTDEEFILKFGKEKQDRRKRKQVLKSIVKSLGGESALD